MDAKELRIGNYVYDRHAKEIEKVTPMWITYQDYWQKHDDKKCLKPIPITEDILLRLGFKVTEKNGLINISINDFIRLELMTIKPEYCVYIVKKQNLEEVVSLERIMYLHQLQNLYHSLTNKELKLKEQ